MERFAGLSVLKVESHDGVDEDEHQEHPKQIHKRTRKQNGAALPERQSAVLLRLFRCKEFLVAGNDARLTFLETIFGERAVYVVLVLASRAP